MRKFIYKSIFFVLPFCITYILGIFCIPVGKGDLLRIGNIIGKTKTYKSDFAKEYSKNVHYTQFSDLELGTTEEFTILTIGDSFSQQRNYGYQNYLSDNPNIKVLHFNKRVNPLQAIYGIINSNIIPDKIKIKYILIQSIERDFVNYAIGLNKKQIMDIKKINRWLTDKQKAEHPKFFSRTTTQILLNLLYPFDDNGYLSKVYITKTSCSLFSTGGNELLFYYGDLRSLDSNNNKKLIGDLNNELNIIAQELKKRNIELIILPSPDKYDVYYQSIINKEKYPKPLFFEYMDKQRKMYHYIDSKKLLSNAIYGQKQKDIYFYGDTHWSPIASKIIAKEISTIIMEE